MLTQSDENMDWLFDPDRDMRKFYQFLQDFKNSKRFRLAFEGIANTISHCCKSLGASIRTLTISTLSYPGSSGEYYHVPWIRLHGRWLERAGFKSDQKVKVVTLKGIILIVPDKPNLNTDYLQFVDWLKLNSVWRMKRAA
ncbi:MAG: SymE family type I addiction module toxin [Niastella sp.]|nr:SymE family type I addiction module toxin [Niastella sp.]